VKNASLKSLFPSLIVNGMFAGVVNPMATASSVYMPAQVAQPPPPLRDTTKLMLPPEAS